MRTASAQKLPQPAPALLFTGFFTACPLPARPLPANCLPARQPPAHCLSSTPCPLTACSLPACPLPACTPTAYSLPARPLPACTPTACLSLPAQVQLESSRPLDAVNQAVQRFRRHVVNVPPALDLASFREAEVGCSTFLGAGVS